MRSALVHVELLNDAVDYHYGRSKGKNKKAGWRRNLKNGVFAL